nr:uncharacterized protein LOC127340063 [Lolium perenne]
MPPTANLRRWTEMLPPAWTTTRKARSHTGLTVAEEECRPPPASPAASKSPREEATLAGQPPLQPRPRSTPETELHAPSPRPKATAHVGPHRPRSSPAAKHHHGHHARLQRPLPPPCARGRSTPAAAAPGPADLRREALSPWSSAAPHDLPRTG